VPVTVDRIEDHGRVRYARARIYGQRITVRVPDGFVASGAGATVVLEPTSIHVYVEGRRVAGVPA
jgi:glycerol transport system ATP-binding protein